MPMGQDVSKEAVRREGQGSGGARDQDVQNKTKNDSSGADSKRIVVVNEDPEMGMRGVNKPLELQNLEKLHKFWPILRSSLDYSQPEETASEAMDSMLIEAMCRRYQQHLTECANVVGIEQKVLVGRLKDLEMFSAGVAHHLMRRQEKITRSRQYLLFVDEVSETLSKVHSSLEHCLPMVQRLNNLLPADSRLEPFKLHKEPGDDDGSYRIDET